MQPHRADIRDLALWAPRVAYGLVIGIPRAPFTIDVPIQFSSSTVNAPPVVNSFQNNLAQDTTIERVSYSLFQQNSFPGSPLQSLYFNQLKQSGNTGVGVQMQVFGAPKYVVNDPFTDLGDLLDVFSVAWPNGWLLPKQSNVKVAAILTQTPVSVPFNVTLTFQGWQWVDKSVDDLSDADARARLRKLGIETPDLSVLVPAK
jgi:hypothetical protein